jgi:glyoxylase-like metal-dependent hydrolase (beta-lactamase superfamily II)
VANAIDLTHPDDPHPGTIAAYWLPADRALVDCGAAAMLGSLEAGLAAHGAGLDDVEQLLLTHIHLDHAGAAGALAAANPRLQVWVHGVGVRHLVDPSRLIAGTRSVYGDGFERLWGEILPVPADRVHAITSDGKVATPTAPLAVLSPGHCRHHVVYLADDGTLYGGDAAGGANMATPGYVEPALPPPDPDPVAWRDTIDRLSALAPARVAITHYGVFEDGVAHLARLRATLDRWVERADLDQEAFVAAANADRAAHAAGTSETFWEHAASAAWGHGGLQRWRERTLLDS